MRRLIKRLLSGGLALALLLSLAPAVLADEPESSSSGDIQVMHFYANDDDNKVFNDKFSEENPAIQSISVTEAGMFTLPRPTTIDMTDEDKNNPDVLPYFWGDDGYKWVVTSYDYTYYTLSGRYARPYTTHFDVGDDSWPDQTFTYHDPVEYKLGGKPATAYATITFHWEPTEEQNPSRAKSSVTYDFNLPKNAHAYFVTNVVSGIPYAAFAEGYINDDDLSSLKTTGVKMDEGEPIPYYPAGVMEKNNAAGLIGGIPEPENGNIIQTYYQLDGWKIEGSDEILYTEDNMPTVDGNTALVAQWTEIDFDELERELTPEQRALEVPFAVQQKTGTDAMISQHSSADAAWSTEGSANDALELEADREVYYKAELSMNPLIAEVKVGNTVLKNMLANRDIKDPSFAHFDIKVELDKALKPVADNNGYVTFKFTCTFLQPETINGMTGVIQDENGAVIYSGGYTTDGDSYVYTVPASLLKDNTTFIIPMEWKPGMYTADKLTQTICLEVAATKVPGTEERTVETTGVITGNIDLAKAGVQETDVVTFLMVGDSSWKRAFQSADGPLTYVDILKAAKQLKNAMADITLEANTVYAHVDGPEPEPVVPEWETSKSKTATNLDENYESQVTLSLPAAEEELVSDVVFVLDKSTSAALEDQALQMLQDLKAQIEETDAKVKVGVVIFNKEAHVANDGAFFDLATEYGAIETAIKQNISSGTNTHAGLLAGKAMLDGDKDVDASRKYLIFVSDGITYMYNTEPTATAWTFWADKWVNWAGPDNWNSKYGSTQAPDDWAAWLTDIGAKVLAQGTTYEYPYGGTTAEVTPQENWNTDYANSVDKALYLTNQAYQEAVAAGYHCYAMMAEGNASYPWASSFMNYLAGDEEVSFESIRKDIYYLLDAGSTVEDSMGYVADDYDFDFVNDASKLTLTVGGQSYAAEKIQDNEYGFKRVDDGYAYTVTYEKGDGKGAEHFVWAINEPVSSFAPVQLTYSVKLVNPKTEAGTYGTYDEDGSENCKGLYTNNRATLYPVDSSGNGNYVPEDFPKPTVSYTVDAVPVNGSLSISKSVNNGDLNQDFTFTVTLTDANGTPLSGTYEYTGSKTGRIASGGTVTLKNGESIAINQLPDGARYTVAETSVDGYTTTVSGHDANAPYVGTSASGSIVAGAAAEVHYTNTGTTPAQPEQPSLSLYKELTEVNGKAYRGGRVETGDALTYTITVENTGTVALDGVTVTDELPEHVTLVNATRGYDYDERAGELTWTTDLSVGEEETFTVTVKVRSAAEGDRLINTARAVWKDLEREYSVRVSVDEDDPYIPPTRPTKPTKPTEPEKPALNREDHVAYIIGYVDGTVRPLNDISRSEVATIFFRLLTDESRAYYWSQTNDYSDVDRDDWFNNAISTLSNAGIITGYLDGTFRPEAPITRAEFAAIAARFSEVVYNGGNSFSDVPENHWAARYIALAEHLGWINGYLDGTFKPEQNITRAEAMTLIDRVLERAVEEDGMLPDMVTWVDNVPGTWYYEAVQEATNSHEYIRTSHRVPDHDFYYEDWQEILTVPDWAALERSWSTANSK